MNTTDNRTPEQIRHDIKMKLARLTDEEWKLFLEKLKERAPELYPKETANDTGGEGEKPKTNLNKI